MVRGGGIKFTKEIPLNSTYKTSAGVNFTKEIPLNMSEKKINLEILS